MFAASYNYGGRPTQDKGETLCFLQQHIVGLGLEKSMSQKVQHLLTAVMASQLSAVLCSFQSSGGMIQYLNIAQLSGP